MRWGLWLLCSHSFLARPAVRGHLSAFVSSCNLRVAALLGVHRAVVANLWMSSGWDQATRRGMSVRFNFGGVTCMCIRSRRRKIFGWRRSARSVACWERQFCGRMQLAAFAATHCGAGAALAWSGPKRRALPRARSARGSTCWSGCSSVCLGTSSFADGVDRGCGAGRAHVVLPAAVTIVGDRLGPCPVAHRRRACQPGSFWQSITAQRVSLRCRA